MARQILQQCLTCKAWSLATTCPACGNTAQAAAPLKWSPEDNRAQIRRKMYAVESKEWGGWLTKPAFITRDEGCTYSIRRRVMLAQHKQVPKNGPMSTSQHQTL